MNLRYPAHIRGLRANLNGTRRAMRAHRKTCIRCTRAHQVARPDLACDTGWEWAKDESRFIRALERAGYAGLTMAGDQLPLF